MKLFELDGPLFAALNKLSDLVFANLLFLLFSLPVVTIGASLTALQTVVLALAEGDEFVVRKRFWQAFRQQFLPATALWGVFLAAGLVLGGSYAAAQSLGGGLGSFYAVFLGALGILLALVFQLAFPLLSRRPAGALATLKTACLLAVVRLPCAAGMLLVTAAAVYLSFFMNPAVFGGALFLWLALGFALVAYCNAFLALRAFKVLPGGDPGDGAPQ